MIIVTIVSAILSFIPAIFVGKHVAVGFGFLCYFLSLIAGIIGFYIGKFLNEFVGERLIVSSGGFMSLVAEKFDALYGPQISGLIIGLFIPVFFLAGTNSNRGEKIAKKAMTDKDGISKTASEYIMPLINDTEDDFSRYGELFNRNEVTKNEKVYVTWEIENNEYIESLKNDIISELIPETQEIKIYLNIDPKTFVPMYKYYYYSYETYDESLKSYIQNDVYKDIINYIKNGKDRDVQPYNSDIALWCKYFRIEGLNTIEKSDYSHWYFDNGKQGSEEEYNEFKNKYVSYGYVDRVCDAETAEYLSKHGGVFPENENKIIYSDIEKFDSKVEKELLDCKGIEYCDTDYSGNIISVPSTSYLLEAINKYNSTFIEFIVNNWNEYPDAMTLHSDFEKQNSNSDFSKYLENKLKIFNENTDIIQSEEDKRFSKDSYLITSISYDEEHNGLYRRIYYFNESVKAFEKDHNVMDYINEQRNKLVEDYYNSDEYKERLDMFHSLVKFDNAKLKASADYRIDYFYDSARGVRNNSEVVLEIEERSISGWVKKEIPLRLEDGKIKFQSYY